ncbi:hypothetical protein CC80DRAFT_491291 [Byssothecium circinans]|uniref:C2H2-type domain-containing protein n=1 Tax=Byssothecium circinans TaxID=147558 RepID=A0A6A5TZW5_9PLEO|nr:hypothetical protein CC80DRAFT_491291 [Byssothecium circinans]
MVAYCHRCDKRFIKEHALHQHVRDSPRHKLCPECDFDGESWDDLLDHCRETNCRSVCQDCDNGGGIHWRYNCDAYLKHLEDENVCTECERHFDNPTNLYQHKLSHRSKSYECYRCYATFKTYGGMIIHLESGTCNDDVTKEDLDATAAECYVWSHFIDDSYRGDMLEGCDLERDYTDTTYAYKCPTCDVSLRKLSSLFQHVESSACSQTLDSGAIGQLRRFLTSRYDS